MSIYTDIHSKTTSFRKSVLTCVLSGWWPLCIFDLESVSVLQPKIHLERQSKDKKNFQRCID